MLLFISMGPRAVVHAFGSLPSGHHLDVKERVKQASAVDPLFSWKTSSERDDLSGLCSWDQELRDKGLGPRGTDAPKCECRR